MACLQVFNILFVKRQLLVQLRQLQRQLQNQQRHQKRQRRQHQRLQLYPSKTLLQLLQSHFGPLIV